MGRELHLRVCRSDRGIRARGGPIDRPVVAPAAVDCTAAAKRWTLLAAVLGSGAVFLDSTVVNVALERIGQELPATFVQRLEGQSYVYNGYLLSLSALLVLAGGLSDFYGRRRMFAFGLAGFGLASLLCGLAPTLEALIGFRILQGAAGALLVPGSMALINTHFQPDERPKAFGIWAAASAATTTLGPPLGGLLIDTLSWRAVFLINIPVIAIALTLALRHVTETRDASASGRFDWLGAAVIGLGIGGLAFGAIRGQETGWRGVTALTSLAVGLLACALFPILMRRSPHPLVPLDLFRSRDFSVINLATLLIYGALYVTFYSQALFFQGSLGYSALGAGLAGLPSGIMIASLSTLSGALAGRFGGRPLLVLGPSIMGFGLLWLSRMPAGSVPWQARVDEPASLLPPLSYAVDVFPAMLAFGLGAAAMVAPLTSVLMASVSEDHSGLASAINNAISRIGPQLVGALVFIALTASFYAALARQLPASAPAELHSLAQPLNPPSPAAPPEAKQASLVASTDAFSLAMRLSAALLFAGAAINGLGLRKRA
ncbi:MAG TPA: MFS transporter [Chloroflexota bacterium]|nr:MFS transporter [Chloroflexota bacterium]